MNRFGFIISFILFLLFTKHTIAADFAVKIFSQYNIKSLSFMPLIGKYSIECDENPIYETNKTDIFSISIEKNKIRLKKN